MIRKKYINDIQTFFDELRSKKEIKEKDGIRFIKWHGNNEFRLHYKVNNNPTTDLLDFETLLYYVDKIRYFINQYYVEEKLPTTFEDLKKAYNIRIYHDENEKPYEYSRNSKRWPAEKEMIFKYALENDYKIEIVE